MPCPSPPQAAAQIAANAAQSGLVGPGGAFQPPALRPGQPEPRRGRSNGSRLVLSFGVNDCEAKLGLVPMQRVWKLLQPLPPAEAPCTVY